MWCLRISGHWATISIPGALSRHLYQYPDTQTHFRTPGHLHECIWSVKWVTFFSLLEAIFFPFYDHLRIPCLANLPLQILRKVVVSVTNIFHLTVEQSCTTNCCCMDRKFEFRSCVTANLLVYWSLLWMLLCDVITSSACTWWEMAHALANRGHMTYMFLFTFDSHFCFFSFMIIHVFLACQTYLFLQMPVKFLSCSE